MEKVNGIHGSQINPEMLKNINEAINALHPRPPVCIWKNLDSSKYDELVRREVGEPHSEKKAK